MDRSLATSRPTLTPSAPRRAFLGGAAASAGALLSGCGGGGGSAATPAPTPAPVVTLTNPQSAPSGPTTAAAVSVVNTNVGAIGPSFAGLSYEKAQLSVPAFQADNTNMIGLFRALGSSLLRIGGNTVDKYSWSPTGAGLTLNQIGPPDIDRLAAFCTATGWQVLYGVNLAQSTPALAASEVAYAAKALGASLYGVEIGNEPDNYAPFDPYPPPTGFSSWTEAAFQSSGRRSAAPSCRRRRAWPSPDRLRAATSPAGWRRSPRPWASRSRSSPSTTIGPAACWPRTLRPPW